MVLLLRYWPHALLLAAIAFGSVQCSLKQKARTDLAQYKQSAAEDLARFQAEARQQEHRHAADMERIGRESQERTKEAGDAAYNRAIADVRAGRLRNVWTCPSVSGAGESAGTPDAGADDRGEAIGRVLRIAAECDSQVKGLQDVIRADRRTQ